MFKKLRTYKKTLLNILYIYTGFSLLIVANLFAAWGFTWIWENDDANVPFWTNNDEWTLTWSVTSTVWMTWATDSWSIVVTSINSELFWDFSVISWGITLYNTWTSIKCWTWGEITYEIWWDLKIKSNSWWIDAWWKMDLVQTWALYSYYCPWLNYMWLTFYSDKLWEKIIGWDAGVLWLIFNASEVSIKWLADINWNLNNLSADVVNWQEILNLKTSSVEWKLVNVTKSINKNIVLITKQKTPLNTLPVNWNDDIISVFTGNWNNEEYYYYNYEWYTELVDNWLGNKWKNLIIQGSDSSFNSWGPTDYQVSVTWKNTVIVKWWNVYINADIYNNNDNTDLLVIIAKRDSNDKQHWWNIYIDPDVTNIDAVLIADWSLIGYNSTNVLNSIVDSGDLYRQLLIYWSVISKNTIWEDIAVYGTDEYIANWWNSSSSKYYNLANFRSPKLAYAPYNYINSPYNCWGDETKVIIGTALSPRLNAWAWKRECFYDWPQNASTTNLRTVEGKVNPLIIEYNSNIKNINPFILRDN